LYFAATTISKMDLEKSLPVAESFVTAEQSTTGASDQGVCLNCETPLTDIYCPHCGQKNIARRQTIRELLDNFISSFWSFESKFLQTGRLLLFKPGKLAREYNAGKRERYYHPARMYVFISFVYFLLFTSLPDQDDSTSNINFDKDDQKTYGTVFGDYKSLAQYDSVQKTKPEDERDGRFVQLIQKRAISINEKYAGKNDELSKDFSEQFLANSSKIFFWLLPVFALLLKLLYFRKDYFYSEHLVFSIYYYNFFFLAGSLYMIMDQIPVVRGFTWILGWWIAIYLLLSMKYTYNQSWGKTILKYCTFLIIFSFCTLLGIIINFGYTIMFL
jgi:predicted RNA-binding Zn-ribbon protein involved in translation (DUF1610 family)